MQPLSDEMTLSVLKEMTECCRTIQELLVQDQLFMDKNDILALEVSNQKKAEQLEKLDELMVQINQHYMTSSQVNIMMRIEQEFSSKDENKQSEMRLVLREFRDELTKCYSSIVKNIDIIFEGMKQFKNIWDKLIEHRSKSVDTYEEMVKKG